MRITAEDLDRWAGTPEARTEFPALLRRLIAHSGARLLRLEMASGSGTDLPGWDGVVVAAAANPWVPEGESRWELSCAKKIASKAQSDLETRIDGTDTEKPSPEERSRLAFVFATPRKWPGKKNWKKNAAQRGWREVRAYDAHDLVQWLESAPAVALWLAERLGKAGPGLESVGAFFARWSKGSAPPITAAALATGRWRVARVLRRLLGSARSPITIRADSEEEAAAFAASVLQRKPSLSARAAVVTAPEGWQWVRQNPDLRFVLCGSSELARGAPVRDGLIVLVPHAGSDASLRTRAEKAQSNEAENKPKLELLPPNASEFASALRRLGIAEPRAFALACRCGPFWSVFRRLHAVTPALRKPRWRERPEAPALSVLALFGAFTEREADRSLVAEVAARPWEEIERDLRILADLPDAPVLALPGYWKAKAIAELFLVMAPRITRGELDRFFAIAQQVLSERDPALDSRDADDFLPITADRFSHSDLLRRSLADALPRLAVLGRRFLAAEPEVEGRIRQLVRDLLKNAVADRWWSLSRHLPALAEAAPDEFLDAVDHGLEAATAAGSALDSSLALLARSPDHLGWVADILCRLRGANPQGSGRQRPDHVLLNIFRPWFPQTNASLEERLEVLATLTEPYPEPAFELLLGMLPGHDTASEHARPTWRDAWLRSVEATWGEYWMAVEDAANRAIALAEGNPDRLTKLVKNLDGLRDAGREETLLAALDRFARANPPDKARVHLRSAVGAAISLDELRWKRPFPFRSSALPLARLWRRLAPRDPVARFAFLFDAFTPHFPGRFEDWHAAERAGWRQRVAAIRSIHRLEGVPGILRLAEATKLPGLVGGAAVRAGIEASTLVKEALVNGAFAQGMDGRVETCVLVAIRNASPSDCRSALETLLAGLERLGRPAEERARPFTFAPDDQDLRDLLEAQPESVRTAVRLGVPKTAEDFRALLAAGRPAAALDALARRSTPPPDAPWLEILEKLAETGPEPGADTTMLSYFVYKAIERLEADPSVDRDRLARFELDLLSFLWAGKHVSRARSLWDRLTSDPAFFVQLLTLAFRAEGEPPRELDNRARARAKRAREVLLWVRWDCPRIPGQRDDGTIDRESLEHFIEQTRELARATGKLTRCDRALGQILAHAPKEPDGRWPCEPVAALLDRPDLGEVRRGFVIGVFNARGVRSGMVYEGGNQERELAEHYRRHARAWSARYPRTALALRQLAETHEAEAVRFDRYAEEARESIA